MKLMRILATKSGPVITIRPEQPVREAVALLTRHNIGALVVVGEENDNPVGIISERDIIRRVAEDEDVFSQPVSELMTHKVITGVPQDDLISVINTMTERRFRHLPVVDNGKLIGIISIGDILKVQRDQYRGEIDTLETQLLADET